MAVRGTPFEGVDNILVNAYTGLDLRLYSDVGNSFTRESVFSDFTELSNLDSDLEANGYAAISLTGTWSSSNGIISYDHGGGTNPTFTNTGVSEDWQTAYGAYLTDGTYVLHWKDFGTPRALQVGENLEIDIQSLVT